MFRNQVVNKKCPTNERIIVSKMVSSYQKLATSTLSRNPKSRIETKIKISVSEGNVIVFPNMLTPDNFWIVITARTLSTTTAPGHLWIPHWYFASALFIFQHCLSFLVLCRPSLEVNHMCSLLESLTTVLCLALCFLHFLLTHASEAYFSERVFGQASSNSSPWARCAPLPCQQRCVPCWEAAACPCPWGHCE